MNYIDLIELGFKRFEGADVVFFRQNGYDWFFLEKKLTKRFRMEWNPDEKNIVQLLKMDKHNVIGRWHITELEDVENLINLLK